MEIPHFNVIEDPVAEDTWSYVNSDGQTQVSRITVGRPRPWPGNVHGDWLCPLEIEHYTDGIHAFVGVGPVDALMNALGVVRGFAEQIGKCTPRTERS